MLAWLVSIGSMKMNNRYKHKKEHNSKRVKKNAHEKTLKTYLEKDEQFL